MQFMITWSTSDHEKSAPKFIQHKFPAGVTPIGSWHALGFPQGWVVVDCNDLSVLQAALISWHGVVQATVVPVLSDEETVKSFAALGQTGQTGDPARPGNGLHCVKV
jgi:hypothetical protein